MDDEATTKTPALRASSAPSQPVQPIEAHKRIDAGIKRGPRKSVNRQPRAALTGKFLSPLAPGQRELIIEDWLSSIRAGQSTADVAARYGITARAIQFWLLADPRAEQARADLIAGELARTLDEMRVPDNPADDTPLRLARAREEFRAWSWIAERRLARLYGQQNQVVPPGAAPVLNITVVQAPQNALQHDVTPHVVHEVDVSDAT